MSDTMKFQFNVNVNDQDYLDYNTFWMIRSPYGKKQIKTFRITITVLDAIFILISLVSGVFRSNPFYICNYNKLHFYCFVFYKICSFL